MQKGMILSLDKADECGAKREWTKSLDFVPYSMRVCGQ
jgi:hypothetical protein